MRLIIAGSRTVTDPKILEDAIQASDLYVPNIGYVLSGCADGVDKMGEAWAKRLKIPVRLYPADWKLHGRGGGPIRNRVMARKATHLVALWDGVSRGTKNMIDEANAKKLWVFVYSTT